MVRGAKMNDTNRSKPATKTDLKDLEQTLASKIAAAEQKLDGKIDSVEQKLNNKIDSVEQNLNGKIDSVEQKLDGKIGSVEQNLNAKIGSIEQNLNGKIDSVETGLNIKIKDVYLEVIKLQSRVGNIEEKMSTKDDISRVLNAIDKFTAVTENYKRKDLERGHMLMDQQEKLQNHETRLVTLETAH